MRSRNIWALMGLFGKCDGEDDVRNHAEVGEDYDWDDVCRLPYESREEGTNSEIST
jgi:hypothetical protein